MPASGQSRIILVHDRRRDSGRPKNPGGSGNRPYPMTRQDLVSIVRNVAAECVRLRIVPALLAIVAVKVLILVADANPRFFLWDSVTYLQGAIGGPLPRDRSFLYSLLIGSVAAPVHSLGALVLAQTLAGAASALLVYFILRFFFALRFGLALAAALLLAIEPSQLFYERMVMAEAFGGVLWLGFVTLLLAYLRDGRALWLPLVACAGILSVSFRLNGTAIILIVSCALPLLRAAFTKTFATMLASRPARRQLALHLALAVGCTLAVHSGYRQIVAEVAHTKPGYIGTEGLFMLGFVAPAVERKDFADTGCSTDLLSKIQRPLRDSRTREYQLWGEAGLWAAMQHDCPQPEAAADLVAHRASHRILGWVLPMAFNTVGQYFDDAESTWRMNSDLGRKGILPLELINIASKFFLLDVRPIAFTDTLTSVWFEHSRWWMTACFLLAPLFAGALLLVTRRDRDATYARMLALVMIGSFLSQFLLSPVIAFRYLHPFPPLMILSAAVLAARWHSQRSAAPRSAAVAPVDPATVITQPIARESQSA
jgi:hypothetical protein